MGGSAIQKQREELLMVMAWYVGKSDDRGRRVTIRVGESRGGAGQNQKGKAPWTDLAPHILADYELTTRQWRESARG